MEVLVLGDIFWFFDGGRSGVYNLYTESALDISRGICGAEQLYLFSEQENRDAISFRWSVSGLTNMDEGLGDEERKTTACHLNYSVSLMALDNKVLDVAENRDVAQ